jgi:hypothetical protein
MNSRFRLPGLLVLASALLFAFLALILDAEAFWILDEWSYRASFARWLESEGLLDIAHHQLSQVLVFLGAISCGLYGLWLGVHRLGDETSETSVKAKRWILGITGAALFVQIMVPSCWSSDVYLYGMHGQLVRVHDVNPFDVSGADFVDGHTCATDGGCSSDYYVARLKWSKHPVAYGPLAVGLFSMAYQPSLEPHDNALIFRVWSSLAALIAVFWMMRLWGLRAAMLFGWSPVLYLSAGNGGHLEPFLVLACLGLVVLTRNRHKVSGSVLGVVAAVMGLIKLPFVGLAAPFVVAKARSMSFRESLWIFAWATLLLIGGYWLVWGDTHPFSGLMAESTKSMRSLLHVIRHLLIGILDADPIQIIRWFALVVVGGWALFRLKRVSEDDVLQEALLIWLVASAFVFGVFHPWHVLPAWALALGLKGNGGVYRAWLYLSQVSPVLVFGAWVVLGKDSFAPWQSSLVALMLFVPALYFVFREKKPVDA